MDTVPTFEQLKNCPTSYVTAVNDTLNILMGKWKLPILASLLYGKKRFKELEKSIPNITARMLSKELRELELNGVVSRTVYDTVPVMIEYALTESGQSIYKVLDVMLEWGQEHRKKVLSVYGTSAKV